MNLSDSFNLTNVTTFVLAMAFAFFATLHLSGYFLKRKVNKMKAILQQKRVELLEAQEENYLRTKAVIDAIQEGMNDVRFTEEYKHELGLKLRLYEDMNEMRTKEIQILKNQIQENL